MVSEAVGSQLEALRALGKSHLEVAQYMVHADGGALYGVDMVAIAILHRSLGLVRGFCSALSDENYLCAAPLVRLQLDNLLRFYALFIVEKPHETAYQIFAGNPVRKQVDMNGRKMTDRYLVERLSEVLPWVRSVYEATSGFIHFSARHMFCSQGKVDEANRSLEMQVSGKDIGIPDSARLEAIAGMIEITKQVLRYVYGWAHTKDIARLAAAPPATLPLTGSTTRLDNWMKAVNLSCGGASSPSPSGKLPNGPSPAEDREAS